VAVFWLVKMGKMKALKRGRQGAGGRQGGRQAGRVGGRKRERQRESAVVEGKLLMFV
jgi:hypothetical protein